MCGGWPYQSLPNDSAIVTARHWHLQHRRKAGGEASNLLDAIALWLVWSTYVEEECYTTPAVVSDSHGPAGCSLHLWRVWFRPFYRRFEITLIKHNSVFLTQAICRHEHPLDNTRKAVSFVGAVIWVLG